MLYDPVRCADRLQRASPVSELAAAWLPARLAERLGPAELTGGDAFLRRRDAAVAAVLLGLSRCIGRIVLVVAVIFQFLNPGFCIGKFRLGRGKLHLQIVYLHVLPAYDAVETPDLLVLLGIRLLKFTQTLVDQAQNIFYVSTLLCHFQTQK